MIDDTMESEYIFILKCDENSSLAHEFYPGTLICTNPHKNFCMTEKRSSPSEFLVFSSISIVIYGLLSNNVLNMEASHVRNEKL